MQAIMITMAGREDAAEETATGLAEAGVSTEIFVQPYDWPVGGEGNHRNSVRALEWAMENVDGPGVLFVEDDIEIKPERFKRAIEAATDKQEVMYFYMHDVIPRTRRYPREDWIEKIEGERQFRPKYMPDSIKDLVVPEGPKRMERDARIFGSQCVYLPRHYLPFLHAHMTYGVAYTSKIKSMPNQAMDTCLNNWHISNNLPVYVYAPHPVQHKMVRTRRKAGNRSDAKSLSFDLKSDVEV